MMCLLSKCSMCSQSVGHYIANFGRTYMHEIFTLQLGKDSGYSTAHINEGALVLQPSLNTTTSILHAQTALLPATNSHLGRAFTPGVDPSDTSLELVNNTVGLVQVLGEDTSGET